MAGRTIRIYIRDEHKDILNMLESLSQDEVGMSLFITECILAHHNEIREKWIQERQREIECLEKIGEVWERENQNKLQERQEKENWLDDFLMEHQLNEGYLTGPAAKEEFKLRGIKLADALSRLRELQRGEGSEKVA